MRLLDHGLNKRRSVLKMLVEVRAASVRKQTGPGCFDRGRIPRQMGATAGRPALGRSMPWVTRGLSSLALRLENLVDHQCTDKYVFLEEHPICRAGWRGKAHLPCRGGTMSCDVAGDGRRSGFLANMKMLAPAVLK